MMNLESREKVVQNLKDAGCGPDIIEDFLLYFDREQKEEQITLLEKHRRELLNVVHKAEKKIYCLDYLIYQIKNEKERGI
ncbi:hypothetical protein NE683_05870 [Bariatricus massiliensis]|uniref:Uncharacterized protein n=1 Tax=Bariatricus massiliensis TaxID=1745713 RepID=A0ABS8DG97_9FIRM|nr:MULTISPECIES: hypothetical protein [Lachnospiraceae]MCB7304027.1 hypothetical protein [Bariatricus massiliensis]MCB7374542.1 hypothetical protein [Bariatricus massiliensis]MCB7387137.1 hypothetical protein [Bariatricus massiliensis]MCB7411299.1 hypothetical protein [Bariatricus massiliensis]MCQ5252755.1 hypothetical protein [Bariatricus massiliensis]